MNFSAIIKHVLKGRLIRRKTWGVPRSRDSGSGG